MYVDEKKSIGSITELTNASVNNENSRSSTFFQREKALDTFIKEYVAEGVQHITKAKIVLRADVYTLSSNEFLLLLF